MSMLNVCFSGEIRKIFTRYPFLSGAIDTRSAVCKHLCFAHLKLSGNKGVIATSSEKEDYKNSL